MDIGFARQAAVLAVGLAVTGALGGCAGAESGPAPATTPARPMSPAAFPKPGRRTLVDLRRGVGPGLELAPGVAVIEPGSNRFAFALFDGARRQVTQARAALYLAPVGGGDDVRGPFPVRDESLRVQPRFESRSVSRDPDAARSVYSATLPFRATGEYEVMALVSLDGRLVATEPVSLRAARRHEVPAVGEPAPRIETPTSASVGGAIATIDTRDPPDTMHDVDFADVRGRRPVVLLFSSPALCRSRVCGSVTDVAEQAQAEHGDEAAFIHMEVYRHNRLEEGLRSQITRWGLPTEPWAFAIDRRGRVAARLEGAFSPRELEWALRKALRP